MGIAYSTANISCWSKWLHSYYTSCDAALILFNAPGSVYPLSSSVINTLRPEQYHGTQVRHADCPILYWSIVEGVSFWVCRRNLPPQQLTWSCVMSISAAIHIVHLSTEQQWPGKNTLELFWTQNSTLHQHGIVTWLPLTISFRFVNQSLVKVFWNESDYWQLALVSWGNVT